MDTQQVNRIVGQTADRISNAFDRMIERLPEGAAPQRALEEVVIELERRQPWLLRLMLEDYDIHEAYYAAVARRPATPSSEESLPRRRRKYRS
jgi:hypothetical protein